MKGLKNLLAALAATTLALSFAGSWQTGASYYIDTHDAGYGVLSKMPEGWEIETQILADGTIQTVKFQSSSPTNRYVVRITPDATCFQLYEGFYALQVTPTDVNAFLEEVDNNYYFIPQEDGSYILSSTDNTTGTIGWQGYYSYWSQEEATAIAQQLLDASVAQEVTLLQGYSEYDRLQASFAIRLFSEADLTEADFAGLGEGWDIDLFTYNGVNVEYQGVDICGGNNTEAWLYQFLYYSLTQVDGVYAVDLDPWYFAFTSDMQYSAGEVITADISHPLTYLRGDPDNDGKVTMQDAFNTLIYYATVNAGNPAAFTTGDDAEAEQASFTAADVDDDGTITIQDAFAILRYYAMESAGLAPSWET